MNHFLLRGKELQEALYWSQGKKLSDIDYRFLSASQELENKKLEVQLSLEFRQKARQKQN